MYVRMGDVQLLSLHYDLQIDHRRSQVTPANSLISMEASLLSALPFVATILP